MAQSLWSRLACCLTGHDYSVRSDRTRMFLRCDACGHTSHGFALADDSRTTRGSRERASGGSGQSRVPPARVPAQ
jgi:hypothetical protein